MRRIISLVDTEEAYVNKLCDYINSNEDSFIKAVPFEEDFDGIKIVLSPDRFKNEETRGTVYKYQSADRVLRDIIKVYDEIGTEKVDKVTVGKACIKAIYSPINRCGKTIFAITAGRCMAENGKTLLLSLDEFEGILRFIAQEAISDLSDVIYSYKKREFSWNKLAQAVYQFGVLSYIPPVRYADDLNEMNVEEVKDMIFKISTEGGYENIVIDFGSYGKRVMELIEICDEVWMPVINEKLSRIKVDEFYEELIASGHEELKNRIREVSLPFEERFTKTLMINEEDYTHGELYEYTRNLFKAPEGTDE